MSSNRRLLEVFAKLARSSKKPARRSRLRLGVEPLEDRIVPALYLGTDTVINTTSAAGGSAHFLARDLFLDGEDHLASADISLQDGSIVRVVPPAIYTIRPFGSGAALAFYESVSGSVSDSEASIAISGSIGRPHTPSLTVSGVFVDGIPDLRIKPLGAPNEQLSPDNIYQAVAADEQIIRINLEPNQVAQFEVRAEQDDPRLNVPASNLLVLAMQTEYLLTVASAGDARMRVNGAPPGGETNSRVAFGGAVRQTSPAVIQLAAGDAPLGAQLEITLKLTDAGVTIQGLSPAKQQQLQAAVRDAIKIFVTVGDGVQPDLLVKKTAEPDGLLLGDDLYEQFAGPLQTISGTSVDGRTVSYDIRIENDGSEERTFRVSNAGFSIHPDFDVVYKLGGAQKDAVKTAAGFETPPIPVGQFITLTMEVTPRAGIPAGTQISIPVRVFADADDPAILDKVLVNTTFGLVVNVEDDTTDADLLADGVLDIDENKSGDQISLRSALEAVNAGLAAAEVLFDIPKEGNARPVIKVGTVIQQILPAFRNLKILGNTQPGANMVELDGSATQSETFPLPVSALEFHNGLTLIGPATISGMFIHSFKGNGVFADPSAFTDEIVIDGNVLSGNITGLHLDDARYRIVNNKIGTNFEGNLDMPNLAGGFFSSSPNTTTRRSPRS